MDEDVFVVGMKGKEDDPVMEKAVNIALGVTKDPVYELLCRNEQSIRVHNDPSYQMLLGAKEEIARLKVLHKNKPAELKEALCHLFHIKVVHKNQPAALEEALRELFALDDIEDDDEVDEDDEDDGKCRYCFEDTCDEVGNEMLLCDSCNGGWHMKCLDPPLDQVPEGEWMCPECVDQENPVILEIETFIARIDVLRRQKDEYEATMKVKDALTDEKNRILEDVLENQNSSFSTEELMRFFSDLTFEQKYWSLFASDEWSKAKVAKVNDLKESDPAMYAKFQDDREKLRTAYDDLKEKIHGKEGLEQTMRELMKTNPFFEHPAKHKQELKNLVSELENNQPDLDDADRANAKKRKGLGGFPV
jgi:phage terminase small subunit